MPEFLKTHLDGLSNQDGVLSEAYLDQTYGFMSKLESREAKLLMQKTSDRPATMHT